MRKVGSYDSYKECHILGVEKKPSHWTNSKWRYVTNVLTDYTANGSFKSLADNVQYLSEPDYARLVRLTDLRANFKNENGIYVDEASYNYLKKSSLVGGEFLIANVGAYAGLVVQMPKYDGLATLGPNMMMARFDESKVNTEFMVYAANSAYIQRQLILKATASSAQPKLNKEDFRSVEFLMPSIEEQKAIVNFLNSKVNKIDKLIKDREKLITLFEEKRRSMMIEAVTKGLNPNVKMKDSGVEWIGKTPEKWNIKKIKYKFDIKKIIRPVEEPTVLSLTQKGLKIKDLNDFSGQHAESYDKYQRVEINDYVMNGMDLLTGYVDCAKFEGVTSPDYRVFRLKYSDECHEYYLRYFQMCYFAKIFYGHGQGVSNFGRWRLQTDVFKNFPIPEPPANEQFAISKYLAKKEAEINEVIEMIKIQIHNLKDYRQSLIYEAVTGKLDTREFEVVS